MHANAHLSSLRERVERALERWLPKPAEAPETLHEAMRHAVLGGGKRMRPLLAYATGEVLGVPAEQIDGPACAVECIHAYSLIHDDLPAMDDDDLRRGRPTCHKAFGEAVAILAGDALQALAFEILVRDDGMRVDADVRLQMVALLAAASGTRGMAGGQAIDLAAQGRALTAADLERMHALKTGALIRASVLLAAMCRPDLASAQLAGLDRFATCAGLAFQIQDDILDVEGDAATLGKTPGADDANEKPTYASMIGIPAARERAQALHREAVAALAAFGEAATPLNHLSDYIIHRRH